MWNTRMCRAKSRLQRGWQWPRTRHERAQVPQQESQSQEWWYLSCLCHTRTLAPPVFPLQELPVLRKITQWHDRTHRPSSCSAPGQLQQKWGCWHMIDTRWWWVPSTEISLQTMPTYGHPGEEERAGRMRWEQPWTRRIGHTLFVPCLEECALSCLPSNHPTELLWLLQCRRLPVDLL